MQSELAGAGTAREIHILGINAVSEASGNSLITPPRPWLQDTSAQNVWNRWEVTWRDVIVLDSNNEVAGIYNLTDHSLAVAANYDSLKALLVKVASQ